MDKKGTVLFVLRYVIMAILVEAISVAIDFFMKKPIVLQEVLIEGVTFIAVFCFMALISRWSNNSKK